MYYSIELQKKKHSLHTDRIRESDTFASNLILQEKQKTIYGLCSLFSRNFFHQDSSIALHLQVSIEKKIIT